MRHESDTVALTCSMILCSSTRSLALAHQLVLISPDSGSAILIVLIVCRCTLPGRREGDCRRVARARCYFIGVVGILLANQDTELTQNHSGRKRRVAIPGPRPPSSVPSLVCSPTRALGLAL